MNFPWEMRGHSFSSAGLSLKEKKKSFQSSAFSCPKNVSRDLTPSVQVHHLLWRGKKSNISCLDVTFNPLPFFKIRPENQKVFLTPLGTQACVCLILFKQMIKKEKNQVIHLSRNNHSVTLFHFPIPLLAKRSGVLFSLKKMCHCAAGRGFPFTTQAPKGVFPLNKHSG